MKLNTRIFTITLSAALLAQFSSAEETASDRALKRYDKADRSTFMGQAKTEKGAAVEAGLLTTVTAKTLWNRFIQKRAANQVVSPILVIAQKTKELQELRTDLEAIRLGDQAPWTVVPGGDRAATIDNAVEVLNPKIENLESELRGLRQAPAVAYQMEEIEARLSSSEGALDVDAFLKEAHVVNKAEREEFLRNLRGNQSKIKKIVVGGVLLYILFDGTARYVLAAKNDRDPTIAPLFGLFAWGKDEGGRIISGSAESIKKFFSSVPENFDKAVEGVKHTADQEAAKVRKSVNTEEDKK